MKPHLFFEIPCQWNIQLWKDVIPSLCNISWTSAYHGVKPAIFHNDQHNKNEGVYQSEPIKGNLLECKFCVIGFGAGVHHESESDYPLLS